MPYRRTSAYSTRGRTAGTSRSQPKPRRRTSLATRARYNRGSYAQSRQIQSLARLAVRNSRILNSQRTYTDYFLNGNSDATWLSSTWKVWSLLDPVTWQQTLRRNTDADNAQNAFVRNMFFQWTVGLYKCKSAASVTLMMVSIRSNAAAYVPSTANISNGTEFQQMGPYQMPILNSNLMKVRWSKTFIVQTNGLYGPSILQTNVLPVGDPSDSYSRGSVNLDIKTTFYSPSMNVVPALEPEAWSTLDAKDLKPSQRVYLLAYFQSPDVENPCQLNFSSKFTVITSN